MDQLVVNLFAGPGSGKSTTRAGVFYRLKLLGVNTEEVTEFAKDLTWGKRFSELNCQAYVFGKQLRNLERVYNQVDVVITDSPILLSSIYAPPDYPQPWHDFVINRFQTFNTLNFFIVRKKTYNSAGRNQSEAEAKQIDVVVKNRLEELNIPYHEIDGDEDAPLKIINHIFKVKGWSNG